MTTLKTIDRLAAKKLHEEFAAAIKASTHIAAFAAKYGLVVTPKNASYDGSHFALKVEARLPGVISAQVIQLAAMVGFDASGTSKDGRFRVTDYAGRGSKRWRMGKADGSEPERYWVGDDRWMLANFPPAPDGSAPKIRETDDLIVQSDARGG